MPRHLVDRTQSTPSRSSASELRLRWVGLGLSLAPILGAVLYNLGLRLSPQSCFFQQFLGIPGPACGMTRSFMAIARGDWQQAWSYHLFGPVLFGICLIVAAQTTAELTLKRKLPQPLRSLYRPEGIAIGMLLFLGYYALRLYARYETGTLPWDWSETAIWQQFAAGAKAL